MKFEPSQPLFGQVPQRIRLLRRASNRSVSPPQTMSQSNHSGRKTVRSRTFPLDDPDFERPGTIASEAVRRIWSKISIYRGPRVFLHQSAKFPKRLVRLFAVYWCVSEVCNGGLHQFFWNPTGVLAPEAVEGFREMGMSDCAELLEQAMQFFGKSYPRAQSRRDKLLEHEFRKPEKQDPFEKLTDRLLAMLGPEDRRRLQLASDEYARKIRD